MLKLRVGYNGAVNLIPFWGMTLAKTGKYPDILDIVTGIGRIVKIGIIW